MRQHRPNAVERAGQVDGDDAVPILGAHLADHPAHGHAGAVDENVDAARSLGDPRGKTGEALAIADVEPICLGLAVAPGDLGRDPFGRRRVAIEDDHPCAGGGEGAARRSTDPVPSAGDQGDLSRKIIRHRTLQNPLEYWKSTADRHCREWPLRERVHVRRH